MKYLTIIILIVLMILLYVSSFNLNVFAASPSFSLEGIYNNRNDWALVRSIAFSSTKNITDCTSEQDDFPPPRIVAVNYNSDGKTLNTTIWLSSPFNHPNSSSSSQFKDVERSYGLLIDIDSAYDIGQTYQVVIEWDFKSSTWRKVIKELPPPSVYGREKVLDQKDNHTDFFIKGKNYIDLPLDLGVVDYPTQYSVVSYASAVFRTKDSGICNLKNITDVIHIPPPEFVISSMPSPIALRTGENKIIELKVKSNTNLDSYISFSFTKQTDGIKADFVSNETYIPPDSIATLPLKVSASEKEEIYKYTLPHSFTLPIFARISFPTTVTNWLTGENLSNIESAIITKNSDLTVTVLPPLTLLDYINNVLNTWGAPVKELIGLVTAIGGGLGIIIGLFLRKFKNKGYKRDKHKKLNEGW